MIDTDKYEGHDTDKRMKLLFSENLLHFELSDADYNLLVDAPLLLEEVKRLREENKELEESLNESHAANKIRHKQLVRAQKWAYKQVCHNDSAMMDYDDYVWGEEDVDISN